MTGSVEPPGVPVDAVVFHFVAAGSWDNVSEWTAKAKLLFQQKHVFNIYKITEVKNTSSYAELHIPIS